MKEKKTIKAIAVHWNNIDSKLSTYYCYLLNAIIGAPNNLWRIMEERDPGGGRGTERDTADAEHIWRNIEQVGRGDAW